MDQSSAMLEIRKIRDENSLRHLSMTDEERRKEADEALKWLSQALGRPLDIVESKQRLRS